MTTPDLFDPADLSADVIDLLDCAQASILSSSLCIADSRRKLKDGFKSGSSETDPSKRSTQL